ncbi:MAG: hypothetical protein U1E50_13915 [Caulobacteraceae bacterium]
MSAFTYGEAARLAFSGFGLVRREPLTVLAWGVFSAAAMALLIGLCALIVAPALTGFTDLARDSAAPPNPARMMGMVFGLLGGYFALLGGALVISAVQGAAVFRAVLEPGTGGPAHLRFGLQEVWLMAVAVSAIILLSMAMTPFSMVMSLVMVMSGALPTTAPPGPDATPAQLLSTAFPMTAGFWISELLIMTLTLLLMSRFVLCFPMTFAERRFRLFEAWGMTRGYTLKMALMLFVQGVSQYIAMIAFILLLGLVAAATVLTRLPEGGMAAMAGKPLSDWIALTWPVIAVAGIAAVPFFGVFAALYYAPLAEVYRRFRPPAADAFT